MKKRKSFIIFFFLLCASLRSAAAPETILGGAYIINMGLTPQTVANGLKPYGMVYDLLKNYRVPVKWIINTSKSKDGIDFSHNGADYSGGSFIIPVEYRTTAVNGVISSWESQGVVGATTVSAITVDVFMTLHHAPIWTLDKDNGSIALAFFTNAGIPGSAYGGSSSSGWKDPSQLGNCDDIFVLPHADPTWATHNNLYYWNLNYKGHIWAGCHAVSVLENITDPTNTIQLNFLSTTGLVPYGSHANGSPPYTYAQSGDGVMQFMQSMDGATSNGSERIYLPKLGGGWRPSTNVGVFDNTQANVPSASPGPAAVVAYGRGFGDAARGWVMYEAGHNLNTAGTVAERVAAQRAFFNFSYFSAANKNAWYDVKLQNIPDVLVANRPYNISFTVPSGVDLASYTIKWSASCAGNFSSTNQQSVTFTPTANYSNCIITASLLDGCGREIFASKGVYLNGPPLRTSTRLNASYRQSEKTVAINWTSFDNSSVQYFEVEKSSDGIRYSPLKRIKPAQDNNDVHYTMIDEHPNDGTGYYRLTIARTNAGIEYSNVAIVNTLAANSAFQVLSNPSRGSLLLKYNSSEEEEVALCIYDTFGQTVFSSKQKIQKGENNILISPQAYFSSGIFILQLRSKKGSFTQKILFSK